MSDTLIVIIVVLGVIALCFFLTWLDKALERSNDRLDRIAEDMYYEQADRDGCEYPPQWRGR